MPTLSWQDPETCEATYHHRDRLGLCRGGGGGGGCWGRVWAYSKVVEGQKTLNPKPPQSASNKIQGRADYWPVTSSILPGPQALETSWRFIWVVTSGVISGGNLNVTWVVSSGITYKYLW